MNKRIDFSKLEGLATYQDTLDFLQESYRGAFIGLAKAFGPRVIVSGVADQGATWGDGWMVIEDPTTGHELLPFVGGVKAAQVIVEELTDTEVFGDDSVQTVYFTRRAKTASVGGVPMSSFVRLTNLASISTSLSGLISTVAGLAVVPTGTICMWSGSVGAIPSGWRLCDGGGGTPDLRGKFVVGYNSGDIDHNAIGKTGGEKKHVLTIDEMPSHSHGYLKPSLASNPDTGGIADYIAATGGTTDSTGGGLSHENRPPYYTIAFIMKL